MSLKYEPASEPMHISVKWLFFCRRLNEMERLEQGGDVPSLLGEGQRKTVHVPPLFHLNTCTPPPLF